MGKSYRGLVVYGLLWRWRQYVLLKRGVTLRQYTLCNIPEELIFIKTAVITFNLAGYNRFPSAQSLLQYNNNMVQHEIPVV